MSTVTSSWSSCITPLPCPTPAGAATDISRPDARTSTAEVCRAGKPVRPTTRLSSRQKDAPSGVAMGIRADRGR